MIESDMKGFRDIIDALSDYYDKDPLSPIAMKIYFRAMSDYSLEQIGEAVNSHIGDNKSGQYFPKAADLIKHLEGGEITADMLVAAAKLAETPLGCLARIHIGSWDLNNQDAFYLRQRAQECLQKLPEWQQRAQQGEYTDHEISVMLKHQVSPAAPFALGLAKPMNSHALLERSKQIANSDRHLAFIEPPYDGDNNKTAGMAPEVKKLIHSED